MIYQRTPLNPAAAAEGMIRNAEALRGVLDNYYRWILAVFAIENGKRILDLGCGPCVYWNALREYEPELYVAADYCEQYLMEVRKLADGDSKYKTCQLDLLSRDIPREIADNRFDYALCFDVLEHLEDDRAALLNIRGIMECTSTSTLFLRVPALPFLYGRNDEAIGHYRRYMRRGLQELLSACGFRVDKIRYQNFLGIFPWFVIGRMAKRPLAASSEEGKLFDRAVPWLQWAENLVPPLLGLSLYCACGLEK